MGSVQRRTIYLALQQAVLDCEENDKLLDVLFTRAYSDLPISGFDYLFIAAFFCDDARKITKTCFIDQKNTVPTNNHDFDLLIRTENILFRDGKVKEDLLANQIVISGEINALVDSSYRNFSQIKTIVISPLFILGKFAGGLILASPREAPEIKEYEIEIIEIFTNFVAFSNRLQETQSSLYAITQEVYKMNAKLHQLDKLKDDFVSVASHELRTPMTAIKSYLWMALNKKGAELSGDMKRYLDRSYISVERLISLVNDMLNISRIEGGRVVLNLSEVDLVDFAGEIVEEVKAKADEKKVSVSVIASSMPKVFCDRDKIHEVFLNLVGNSLKFTPEGGKITVDFSLHDPQVKVRISDTGRGLADEDVPKLFLKFGRLDNSYVSIAESGGTGLGLYITKSLVDLHKGTIEATSEGIGKGSQFTFSLPVAGSDLARKLVEETPKETEETKELEKTSVNI